MTMISRIYGNNLYAPKAIASAKKKISKKNIKKKKALNQSQVCRFTKLILGYGMRINVSMWTLAYEALERSGCKNTENLGHEKFVLKHADYIKKTIGEASVKRNTAKKYHCDGVASDEFLNSYEWRKLRLTALKMHGRKCQCCGASPQTGAVMNVDHIKPRRFYPELALDINNLQVLCHECNHGKGNWDETDWRNIK